MPALPELLVAALAILALAAARYEAIDARDALAVRADADAELPVDEAILSILV